MLNEIIEFFVTYWRMLVGMVVLSFILLIACLPTISKWVIKTDLADKVNKKGDLF